MKDLKKQVTCSICLDTYNEPKTISYLHTFCCKCLEKHAIMSQRQGKFRCPECHAEIDLPEGNRFDHLPISFFHKSLSSLLAVRQSGNASSIACSHCRKTNSQMYYCFDCGRFMCLDCFNAHQLLIATFEGHKVNSSTRKKSHGSFARSVKFAFVQSALSRIIKTTSPFCSTKQHTTKKKTSCLALRSSRKKKPNFVKSSRSSKKRFLSLKEISQQPSEKSREQPNK